MADVKHKAGMVIKDFFGYREECFRATDTDGKTLSGLQDFAAEMKRLSSEEKIELARLAGKAMGYTPEEIGAIGL